jgi:hypothetical protein
MMRDANQRWLEASRELTVWRKEADVNHAILCGFLVEK